MRVLILAAALLVCGRAAADECNPVDERGPFRACFDLGNRAFVFAGASSDEGVGAVGGAIQLRHIRLTDDSDVSWRFEHTFADVAFGELGWRVALYQGRYLRHSQSGHLMLPGNRRIATHSDVGVEANALTVTGAPGDPALRVGAVRAAIIAEFLRAPDFTRRLQIGLVARWDLTVDTTDSSNPSISEERVAPLTMGAAALHLESHDGLTGFDLAVEGGEIWSNTGGWSPTIGASGSIERVLIAVNDRPISLYLAGGWDDRRGARGLVGLRLALVSGR